MKKSRDHGGHRRHGLLLGRKKDDLVRPIELIFISARRTFHPYRFTAGLLRCNGLYVFGLIGPRVADRQVGFTYMALEAPIPQCSRWKFALFGNPDHTLS